MPYLVGREKGDRNSERGQVEDAKQARRCCCVPAGSRSVSPVGAVITNWSPARHPRCGPHVSTAVNAPFAVSNKNREEIATRRIYRQFRRNTRTFPYCAASSALRRPSGEARTSSMAVSSGSVTIQTTCAAESRSSQVSDTLARSLLAASFSSPSPYASSAFPFSAYTEACVGSPPQMAYGSDYSSARYTISEAPIRVRRKETAIASFASTGYAREK